MRLLLLTIATGTLCCLFATLGTGCVFVQEECDYVETQCWDVHDVYCDPWGCWEEVYTECEDYCVDAVNPAPAPECTQDYHCAGNDICLDQRCVARSAGPDPTGGAGLCEACDVNADCQESGALCLNLTENADVGYCGRSCDSDASCPSGFECLDLSGGNGSQCVPETRSCSATDLPDPPVEDECLTTADCTGDQICEAGDCVDPVSPECTEDDHCDGEQVCVDELCVDPEPVPECVGNDDCDEGLECVDGDCSEVEIICTINADCGESGICVDGSCRDTCETDDNCTGGQVCRAGLCSAPPEPECATGSDCGEGDFYCVNGMCRDACASNDECELGYLCRGFYCDVDPAVECRSTLECGIDQECVSGECLTTCSASCNCPTGLSCDEESGFCADLPVPESCETDCDCPGGFTCSGDSVCVEG